MRKINILWISLNAPAKRSERAGGNTFNYYFRSFYEDKRFNVKVIAQINNKLPVMDLKEDDCFYLMRESRFSDKLRRLSSIESKYNPWNRNANLISNQMENFVVKKIKYLKGQGFEPEVVILEWTQCVVLARLIRKIFPHVFIVASEHDVTYIGYQRQKGYYSGIKKILWKIKCKQEKKVEINSLKICDLILPHNPDNIDILIEEGIDSSQIQWLTPYFNNMKNVTRRSNYRDILFFGAMSRPENYLSAIWFIDNVMPLLADEDIRFVILGGSPPERLKKYQNDNIIITGFVDSIEPFFEQAMCLVAPLVLGAGIKVKILEALSSGIPVLTNDIGIEGIPAVAGKEYEKCLTPVEYAKSIRKAISGDLDLIGDNGKKFIENNYDVMYAVEQYKNRLASIKKARTI